jgi:hypothetical protein
VQIKDILAAMEEHATNFEKVATLNDELQPLIAEKEKLEDSWVLLSQDLD